MENTDITVTILRYLENTDITVTILRNIQGITTATWRRDRAAIGKRKRLISIWWLYITKLLNFVKKITKLLNFMKYLLMKYFTKLLNFVKNITKLLNLVKYLLMKYFTKLLNLVKNMTPKTIFVICLLFSYIIIIPPAVLMYFFQVTYAVLCLLVLNTQILRRSPEKKVIE